MSKNNNPVQELSESECQLRLSSHTLGRLVTRVREVVDIFPVNYVVDDGDIVLRTGEGTKLTEIVIGDEVLFEVDEFNGHEAWSVVVRGSARLLETEAEIAVADALPLKPMVPTLKRSYVRITPRQTTGRAFAMDEEPPRDGMQNYAS